MSLSITRQAKLAPTEAKCGNRCAARLDEPGDLIVGRQNDRIAAGTPQRWLANRDVLRIEFWDEIGEARVAIVRRMTSRDRATGEVGWSPPFELPEDYLERHAELAYAGNVHVAEGRTVETGHLVVDETAGRQALYVGMTRGSERNTAHVITERPRAADLSPSPALRPPSRTLPQTRTYRRTG